jgi:hypothetical protein
MDDNDDDDNNDMMVVMMVEHIKYQATETTINQYVLMLLKRYHLYDPMAYGSSY